MARGRQIAINGHTKFNLTMPLQQLNGLETLVIIMVANKYAFLQITRRRFLNEWEAFKKVISRRNIRRRRTIPLTLSNLKLLRRISRTENSLHRIRTRRQVAIQNRGASNIGISQSTFSVKVLNLFSLFFQAEDGIRDVAVTGVQTCALPISGDLARPCAPLFPHDGSRHGASRRGARRAEPPARRPRQGLVQRRHPQGDRARAHQARSEERRVGKECRSRWSPYH